ncbi:MAG: Plug domain-containing protein, partial [Rikenellaceae bacterium]|nr:Plug domain-containing protein [Rikenellaceae bacterium]
MRKRIFILLFLVVSLTVWAEERDWLRDGLEIPDVEVVARRPMRDIGVEQTKIDSAMLHQNISLSMADILSFNSSIFVKNSGRATLSTVSFRGTSPSHTQVLWNGLRINSPMLGMTDFSMIPSFLVDRATLLHGSSSITESGGGLGGAVKLATEPIAKEGFGLHFVQGVGSFWTFDDFLRLTYGKGRWHSSTRVVFSTSKNNYRYRNYDKKENI